MNKSDRKRLLPFLLFAANPNRDDGKRLDEGEIDPTDLAREAWCRGLLTMNPVQGVLVIPPQYPFLSDKGEWELYAAKHPNLAWWRDHWFQVAVAGFTAIAALASSIIATPVVVKFIGGG